jgi:hypothetical protein
MTRIRTTSLKKRLSAHRKAGDRRGDIEATAVVLVLHRRIPSLQSQQSVAMLPVLAALWHDRSCKGKELKMEANQKR